MQHIKGSNLVFGELIWPLEIIGFNLFLLFLGLDFLGINVTTGKLGQKPIYCLL